MQLLLQGHSAREGRGSGTGGRLRGLCLRHHCGPELKKGAQGSPHRQNSEHHARGFS